MDKCSYFIKDKALFGSYPTQNEVNELEQLGVKHFFDLTAYNEKKITPYKTKYSYYKFPIEDRKTPTDKRDFARFIIQISTIITNSKITDKIYIHCRGGHGRAGIVVACLLCYLFGLTSNTALEYTNNYHNQRKIMRDKWRRIGSPQTFYQKNFVHKFFKPLYFRRAYKKGKSAGFSNFTEHKVEINLGVFHTAEAAFQALKNPTDEKFVNLMKETKDPKQCRILGKQTKLRNDWKYERIRIMQTVIKAKFDQHDYLRENLLNSSLRPIVYCSIGDYFWGDGQDSRGKNYLGKILTNLRNEYYSQLP